MSKKTYRIASLFSGCGGLDLGFTGGFATGGEDPYAYDVNGRKAKRTGSNEFTTEDGTKYKKVQSGWGEDFKRE